MRKTLIPLFLLSVSLATAASPVPKVAIDSYRLPNGLTVILHEDRKLPIVHVNEWFHVGSKNERPGRTGFAHLFEHMMFQGSKNAPEKYFSYVEKVGANLREGGVNGTTDFDRTNYFVTAPSSSLEFLLWVESDRLAGLLDAMTQAKLDNQRDVVKNERRQSYENVPYGRAFTLMNELLFPSGHPYSWPVIGSQQDLTAATMDDVKEFFKRFYTPNNLTLTIAGDFDAAQAKKLVEKYFGAIPAGPALERPTRLPAVLSEERRMVVSDRVPQARSYLVWPAPAYFEPGEADLDLASVVLADGLSSRLQKRLVYDKQLCTSIQAFEMAEEIAGAFVIMATARPGESLDTIETAIGEELHRLAEKGPEPAELARALAKREFDFVTGLERIGGFGGKADQLGRYNTFLGKPDMFAVDLERYRQVTAESMRAAVARTVDNRRRAVLRFVPEASGRASESTIDRSKPPAVPADRPFDVPKVASGTLPNGLSVFVVSRSELPKVAIALTAKGGAASEAASKAGLGLLTLRTLDRGTKTRSALEIDEAFSALGTQLGRTQMRDWQMLTTEVLTPNAGKVVELLADVVQHPAFTAEEFDRERKKVLDEFLQEQQAPRGISRRALSILGFGAEHPYGHAVLGDKTTLDALTPGDVQSFWSDRYRPGNCALSFAGDITLDQAMALATAQFGGWSGSAGATAPIPPPAPAPAGRIYAIDRQDAAQTAVSLILPGITRGSPDYYVLQVADAVFGGGFGTRLNLNLREAKGYSYGVFSSPACLKEAGLWYASGDVQTKVTKESIVEFVKELKGIAGARPITAKELDEAKAARIRGYAQGFETLAKMAGRLGDLWALGRPHSDMEAEPRALAAVTLEQANAAAKKYADPSKALLLVVGDMTQIAKGLAAAGFGPVERRDTLGRAMK